MKGAGLIAEIQRLQAEGARERLALERATAHPRDRFEPMESRLAKQLAKIPAEVQRDGLAMEYLCALVQGQKGRGAFHHVSAALRKLGWYRLRCWSRSAAESGGFRALWYPPQPPQAAPGTSAIQVTHP